MGERGARRGAGAPFYAPPRRKTSAEIISEARAAVYGDSSGASSGAGGVLRPLRTRRPYTPREPQRTLFGERNQKKDTRPPSAFDLKYLTLSENVDEDLDLAASNLRNVEPTYFGVTSSGDKKTSPKKIVMNKPTNKFVTDRSGDWAGLPRLPHLSGRSKPLHRRNTTGQSFPEETKAEIDLAQAITVITPLRGQETKVAKTPSPDVPVQKRPLTKSMSCDTGNLGDVAVTHLAVQMPSTSMGIDYDNCSLIELSELLTQKERDLDRSLLLINSMQNVLEVNPPSPNLQDLVLRALYSHVDVEDERLMVAIARAMLTMRVTGVHLAAACKLIFKIARNDKNDHFFKNSNLLELLIEGCGRADPLSEAECCVYAAGALRFLALEPALCARAASAGAIHLAALHMKILNTAKAENPRSVTDQSIHALFQLTGGLRNLAAAGDSQQFVTSGALQELINVLLYHTDREVLTNVARCLSVLSARAACCAWLCARAAAARAVLRGVCACAARPALTVRLTYVLGNMAAADRSAAEHIYNETGGVDVLLTILESYSAKSDNGYKDEVDPDLHLVGTDLSGSDGSTEDVLIKTVRVIANLCLSVSVGRALATHHAARAARALLQCLSLHDNPVHPMKALSQEKLESVLERRTELATASLATLNNITFYRHQPGLEDPDDPLIEMLCKVVCRWLSREGPASWEAVRTLGNLSRNTQAAQLIVLEGALDQLEPFFTHEELSVRCGAAGVLVNVCGAGVRAAFTARLAVRALRGAARRGDHVTGTLLARALWNAHSHQPLSAALLHDVVTALNIFIDDDSVFAPCEAVRGERRASDPEVKHHVSFDSDDASNVSELQKIPKAYSVDQDLHLGHHFENGTSGGNGEDLGFEDGDLIEECDCVTCRRLTEWEELVSVAIPLLEKLKPPKTDASVGTD